MKKEIVIVGIVLLLSVGFIFVFWFSGINGKITGNINIYTTTNHPQKECKSLISADCPNPEKPICNLDSSSPDYKKCMPCETNNQCITKNKNAPNCKPDEGKCYSRCTTDEQCISSNTAKPKCNTQTGECVNAICKTSGKQNTYTKYISNSMGTMAIIDKTNSKKFTDSCTGDILKNYICSGSENPEVWLLYPTENEGGIEGTDCRKVSTGVGAMIVECYEGNCQYKWLNLPGSWGRWKVVMKYPYYNEEPPEPIKEYPIEE
jgi:hypothetical protein